MQINPLRDLLEGIKLREPDREYSLPSPRRTPPPEANKVIGSPDRTPINKQAALMISPMRCWLSQPIAENRLPTREHKEIDQLKAELKTERNSHALTRDDLGNTRAALKNAKAMILELQQQLSVVQKRLEQQDGIIRQLEDLRL